MTTINTFLASSNELEADRRAFELHYGRLKDQLLDQGIRLNLKIWEASTDAMQPTRSQDAYNALIQQCQLFVLLAHTKVGKYTREEFEVARTHFLATGQPRIYVYFKTTPPPSTQTEADRQSLAEFQGRLQGIEYFPAYYAGEPELWNQFRDELDKYIGAHAAPPPPTPQAGGVNNTNTKIGQQNNNSNVDNRGATFNL